MIWNWICQLNITGEKLSEDFGEVVKFRVKFQKLIKVNNLFEDQQFNRDETGLNSRLLLSKILVVKGEASTPTCKKNKGKVTVLGCFNASVPWSWNPCWLESQRDPEHSQTSTSRIFIYITDIRKVCG